MPTISVIVPVYKVEPYLHRCVDSILAQTFEDFELILVDDGSPDNCPTICDEYAAKDSRVVVIHQENGGLSAARNAGIDWAFAHSDSQWLTFVDSDDWVHCEMLQVTYSAAIQYGSGVVVAGIDAVTSYDSNNPYIQLQDIETITCTPDEFYSIHFVNPVAACMKLYSKNCFHELRFPLSRLHEDAFTTYKALFKAQKITALSCPMYYYFFNPNSITRTNWHSGRLDELTGLEEQLEYLKRNNYSSAYDRMVPWYFERYLYHISELKNTTDKQLFAYKKTYEKKLKFSIKKYGSALSEKQRLWVYEVAYPNVMKWYWRFQSL